MNSPSLFRYSDEVREAKRAYRAENPVPLSPWTDGHVDDICAINLVPPEKLTAFFLNCIAQLQKLKGVSIGDYLEFGVFNGNSIGSMHTARARTNTEGHMRLFGFDAFQGLPKGSENEDGGVWKAGFYACSFLQTQECLGRRNINHADIHWVEGWYNETLTDSLSEKYNFSNIGVVMVDCDTYSSSKTVLDFIGKNLQSPAIICFDDWKLNDLDISGEGEYRAFNEFLEENPQFKATRLPSYNRKSESFLLEPA